MKCEYGCDKKALFQLKNGKWCCSKSANSCKALKIKNSRGVKAFYASNPESVNRNTIYKKCSYCNKEFLIGGSFQAHKKSCYLNPKNIKLCLECNEPIKNWQSSTTCGYKCSNKYYKQHEIKDLSNRKVSSYVYRRQCFKNHKKQCIICGEKNIVAVHHYDGNRKNNESQNLIPLCPTHHVYWHSSFKHLIEDKVIKYVNEIK